MWGPTSPICVNQGCAPSLPFLRSLNIDEVEHNTQHTTHSLYSSFRGCHNHCLWISCRSTSSQCSRWFLRWKQPCCKPSKDNFQIFHTSVPIDWQAVFTPSGGKSHTKVCLYDAMVISALMWSHMAPRLPEAHVHLINQIRTMSTERMIHEAFEASKEMTTNRT